MPGTDAITIFPVELLEQRKDLKREVLDAVDRFGTGIGWHYLLDLVWLLERIEDLPEGSLILDAGAGHGLLQMLLAARGHRVLSVDFAPRVPSEAYRRAASIRVLEDRAFSNDYIKHLMDNYPVADGCGEGEQGGLGSCLDDEAVDIIFWRADLSDLSGLADGAVDAVVSVSARLKQGEGLKEHLASFYFLSGNNGMPWGKWDPQYFPVGVTKWKA
jgi:SAM-dependent methyltransferase